MRRCLVLGSAGCVWDDVEAALEIGEYSAVIACNDIAADWPGPVDAAASLHPDLWPMWAARRAAKGYPPIGRIFDASPFFPGQHSSGSSGLFALKVALVDLGFDRAVLCGVPLVEQARHIANHLPWRAVPLHQPAWLQAFPAIGDRARSMSGWTAEKLGRPDAAWLNT